jgi:hypothetical protein
MFYRNGWKNYYLLGVILAIFCASPALSIAEKSNQLFETAYIAARPGINADVLEEMEIDKVYFKEDVLDFESIVAVPKRGLMAVDSLREYIIDKQQFFSDRDFETKTWSVAPLIDNHANSHPAIDMPIGVIFKIRF